MNQQELLHEDPLEACNPFIKWVGGKRQLLSSIKDNMPNSFNKYYEPFIGGGALFFSLAKKGGTILDTNEELINLYKVVSKDPNQLIKSLSKHINTKEYFYEIRSLDRDKESYRKLSSIERASRFVYLNKTCFNGLFRVNKSNQFNVPVGDYKNPIYIDQKNLLQCHNILKHTNIICGDFSEVENITGKNDFVYFDPPYIPLNTTSNFTTYTKDGFNIDMQEKLRNTCNNLNKKKVKFLLSNSDTPITRELYKEYNIVEVFAKRNINSKSSGRGKIKELLIRNYTL